DEDESLARLDDPAGTPVAVGERGRDGQLAATAHAHTRDTPVPSRDHLTGAEAEVEGLAAVPGRIELLAAGERNPDVVHADGVARSGCIAVADRDVLAQQVRGRLTRWLLHYRFRHALILVGTLATVRGLIRA